MQRPRVQNEPTSSAPFVIIPLQNEPTPDPSRDRQGSPPPPNHLALQNEPNATPRPDITTPYKTNPPGPSPDRQGAPPPPNHLAHTKQSQPRRPPTPHSLVLLCILGVRDPAARREPQPNA